MPFHLYQNANSVSFRHSHGQNTNHPNACFWVREIDEYMATRLSALGDARLDVVELDVVGVVGLDVGGKTVEGTLDSLFGRAVHHAGLCEVSLRTA